MVRILTYFRYLYLILLCFIFSTGFAMDKNTIDNSIPTSENVPAPTLIFFTGDQIDYNTEGIIIIQGEYESVMPNVRGKVELQASNRIIFRPGTKIAPGKGEFLQASIIEELENIREKENDHSLFELFTSKFSKSFKKENNTKDNFNKQGHQIGTFLSISGIFGLIDFQQRRVGNEIELTSLFLTNHVTLKYNVLQEYSGFQPETIEVLRL